MVYSSLGQSPTVISHNAKGLNVPEKRTTLLRELKKGKPHFVFLQETHFKTRQIPKLTKAYISPLPTTPQTIQPRQSFDHSEQRSPIYYLRPHDPEGRFIFLKGAYGGSPITLANVYFQHETYTVLPKNSLRVAGVCLGMSYPGWGLQYPFKSISRYHNT